MKICYCLPSIYNLEGWNDGKDGILGPLGSEHVFVERLGELIRNSALRKEMEHRAKNNIRRFPLYTTGKQWKTLFENLLRQLIFSCLL